MNILEIIDILLFVIFATNVCYNLLFSVASHFNNKKKKHNVVRENAETRTVAILIPAYKEDYVIEECVNSCLKQNYPKEKYDIIVISDRMKEETNNMLLSLDVNLIEVFFENSTKAKALNLAMSQIKDYDIAVVLDADNKIFSNFLSDINDAFSVKDTKVIQAHRCTKNTNTRLAILDAVSEEINNSIYRQGHVNLGLSAALIGSGMAFNYTLFKDTMLNIDAIGGFDRALELTILKDKIQIAYLPNTLVLDEKVQYHTDFSRQRRRWLSAQLHYMKRNIKEIIPAIKAKNIDLLDKIFQQMSIPRLLLLGFLVIISIVLSFVFFAVSIKWWILLIILCLSLLISIPKPLLTRKFFVALIDIPYTFCVMAFNLFRLRGANKKFIHTKHGLKK